MSTTKVAISIDEKTLSRLDRMVAARKFPSRSRAIQDAVEEKISSRESRRCCSGGRRGF